MSAADDASSLEFGLECSAWQFGDITAPVMALFTSRHHDAPARFAAFQAQGRKSALEGEMVAQTLHCIMKWSEDPLEVESILWGTLPHHAHTLNVCPTLICGMFEAVCDTVIAAMPAAATRELAY
jgi:hypothetical protein